MIPGLPRLMLLFTFPKKERLSSEAELPAKPIHHLMQHFDLFEKDTRSLAFDRASNERIFQISVVFHPILALCEPLLGKRKLVKILPGDHKSYPGNAFQQALGNQHRCAITMLRREDRSLIYLNRRRFSCN
jgi:hypothetical protein